MSQKMMDFGTFYSQITDTYDDDAKAKIHSAVIHYMPKYDMAPNFSLLGARNSIAVGTKASELITNTERPERLILAVNYAPPNDKRGTVNNARKDFFCADLGDNDFVCGTSNGYEFSYVKPKIKEFYRLTNTNHIGSQFRSLQVLPKHAIAFSVPEAQSEMIANGILERVDDIDDIIPSVPDITHVLQIDKPFNNVKLVPSQADRFLLDRLAQTKQPIYFSFGKSSIEVSSDKKTRWYRATASDKLFDVAVGTNVIAAQSSSLLTGNRDVPMIATVRDNPGESNPAYFRDLPETGYAVFLSDTRPPFFKVRGLLAGLSLL